MDNTTKLSVEQILSEYGPTPVTSKSEEIFKIDLSLFTCEVANHDMAIITAFRRVAKFCALGQNREDGHQFTLDENKDQNKQLHATLLRLKYGVTKIDGSYLEDFGTPSQTEVREDAFFVVNLEDDPAFADHIIKLGEFYCQDSVFIKPRKESAYLMGTNYAEFPGYHNRSELPDFHLGKEGAFMSRIGNQPFHFESMREYNVGGKSCICKIATPVIKALKLKIQPTRNQNAE